MQVVTGVDLEINAGETVALLGRNGAGKSTTLLSIAGLRFGMNSGNVTLGGTELSKMAPPQVVKAGVALVPEGRRVFAEMSVAENLRLGAFHRRRLAAEVKSDFERALELFPILRSNLGRLAAQLSGGQQQMLVLAQAVMSRPAFLLLDEPTAGLAPIASVELYAAIEDLRLTGLGILVVDQSVERAMTAATRTYVMEGGHIVYSAPSSELAQRETERIIIGSGMT
jgi:branched-chain amino acid transport system ATP-binding protein